MGRKLGDVRGVLEVSIVIESQLAQGAKLNTIVLGLVAATGTIIILACVYFVRKISAPLSRMSIAFRKLRDQDFDIEVSDTGRADELGTLARGIEAFKAESMKAAELRGEQEALQKRAEQERSELLTGMIAEFEKNVGAVVDSVATAAEQMNNSAELMSQSSGQTTSESEGIASAAESALSSVQTMASPLKSSRRPFRKSATRFRIRTKSPRRPSPKRNAPMKWSKVSTLPPRRSGKSWN